MGCGKRHHYSPKSHGKTDNDLLPLLYCNSGSFVMHWYHFQLITTCFRALNTQTEVNDLNVLNNIGAYRQLWNVMIQHVSFGLLEHLCPCKAIHQEHTSINNHCYESPPWTWVSGFRSTVVEGDLSSIKYTHVFCTFLS